MAGSFVVGAAVPYGAGRGGPAKGKETPMAFQCNCTLFVLLAVCTTAVAAQTTVNLNGTVPSENTRYVRFDIDHGATAQAITVTATLTTTSAEGIEVEVVDLDTVATNTTYYGDMNTVTTAGTATVVYTSPSRAGIHSIVVDFENGQAGTAVTPFTGSVSVSAGSIVQTMTNDEDDNSTAPFSVNVGAMINGRHQFPGNGSYTQDFQVDFGPTAQAVPMRFFAIGFGTFTDLKISDITDPTPVPLGTYAGGTNIGANDSVTTPSRSGIVTIRVESTANASALIGWVVALPTTAIYYTGGGGGGDGGDDEGCAAADNGTAPWMLLLLAATGLASAVATRRRA